MRKAPCISTDQSEIQEATTNHKGPGEFIIAGSLHENKEETNNDHIPHHNREIH